VVADDLGDEQAHFGRRRLGRRRRNWFGGPVRLHEARDDVGLDGSRQARQAVLGRGQSVAQAVEERVALGLRPGSRSVQAIARH